MRVLGSASPSGILVKGPLILMFVGLAAVSSRSRERSARWLLALRPARAAIVTLAVVLPWFVAIALKSGGAFFAASVGQDMLGKVGQRPGATTGRRPATTSSPSSRTFWPGAILAAIAVPFAWSQPARGPGRLPARLDRAVLARLRGRADQAAALRAAALSGDRDRHRAGDPQRLSSARSGPGATLAALLHPARSRSG